MTKKVEMERMLEICGQLMYSASVAAVNKYKTECDTLKTEIEHLKSENSELMKELKESVFKVVDMEMKKWIESGKWKDEIDQEKSKYVLDKLYRCTNKYDGSVIIGKAWYKESSPCKGWNFSYDEGSFNEHHCEKIEPYDGVDTKKKNDEVSNSEAEETSNWFDKLQACNERIADLEDRIDHYKKHCDSLTAEISIRDNRIKELEEGNKRLKDECIARRDSEEDFKWERDQYKKERDELAARVGKEKDGDIEGECEEGPTSETTEVKTR